MSCLYCGGETCGSSAGGPTMCDGHPDNKQKETENKDKMATPGGSEKE